MDWYKIPDRTFSRSVPLRINHNVPIPVLLVDGGKTLIVGGTSGNVKVLDAHTAETTQTLDHDRMESLVVEAPFSAELTEPNPTADDFIQALVRVDFIALPQQLHIIHRRFTSWKKLG